MDAKRVRDHPSRGIHNDGLARCLGARVDDARETRRSREREAAPQLSRDAHRGPTLKERAEGTYKTKHAEAAIERQRLRKRDHIQK